LIQQKKFELSFSGTALEDGFIGKTILVQSDYKDKKIFTGEILDANHIRIKMGY
jgi:hypothetical protein